MRAIIGGIHEVSVRLLGKRMDELACKYAQTQDQKVKAELEELSRQLAD
jgi:hypothetical protein